MKILYTSNYARIPQFTKEFPNSQIIATSCWVARWHKGKINEQRLDIAPTWEMVEAIKNGEISEDEYALQYRRILANLNVNQLVESIPNEAFLLCFEKPTDFCHRHILAEWINDRTDDNVNVIEWNNPKEREKVAKENNLEDLIDI